MTSFEHVSPVLLKLPEYLAASGYREPDPPAKGPYPFISGGKSFWDRAIEEPILQERFDNFMNAQRVGPNWIDLISIDEVFRPGLREGPDAVLLVDIGGGVGHDLKYFKQKHGHLPGRLVVADLPATIDYARQKPHDGVELQPYDMFTPQPIKGKSPSGPRSIGLFGTKAQGILQAPGRTTSAPSSTTGPTRAASRRLRTPWRPWSGDTLGS